MSSMTRLRADTSRSSTSLSELVSHMLSSIGSTIRHRSQSDPCALQSITGTPISSTRHRAQTAPEGTSSACYYETVSFPGAGPAFLRDLTRDEHVLLNRYSLDFNRSEDSAEPQGSPAPADHICDPERCSLESSESGDSETCGEATNDDFLPYGVRHFHPNSVRPLFVGPLNAPFVTIVGEDERAVHWWQKKRRKQQVSVHAGAADERPNKTGVPMKKLWRLSKSIGEKLDVRGKIHFGRKPRELAGWFDPSISVHYW